MAQAWTRASGDTKSSWVASGEWQNYSLLARDFSRSRLLMFEHAVRAGLDDMHRAFLPLESYSFAPNSRGPIVLRHLSPLVNCHLAFLLSTSQANNRMIEKLWQSCPDFPSWARCSHATLHEACFSCLVSVAAFCDLAIFGGTP